MQWVNSAKAKLAQQELSEGGSFQPPAVSNRTSTATAFVTFRWLVRSFVVGGLMGIAATAAYHWDQIKLRDGYDRQGGLLHIDPIGNKWFDDKINGARGTSGMRNKAAR